MTVRLHAQERTDRPGLKIALLLGGALSPERKRAALHGDLPRVDVMEMESRFGAQLYDYEWFTQRAGQERFTRGLLSIARRFGHWSELLVLRAVWSLRDADVVYITGEDVGLPAAAFLRLLGWKRPRLVLRMEQPIFGRTRWRRDLFSLLLRFAVPRIDLILCRTEAHAVYLQEKLLVSPAKVRFSPETTDTVFFDASGPEGKPAVSENIPHPYLVSAGLEMRDYDTLVQAVRGLPVTALICAGSPWAKVSYQAREADLPENVRVAAFSRAEMRELYRSAAFVVLPIKPTQRACGMNVVLEAWAMGRAVIASRTEGLTSYIQDGEDGYLVPPGDVDELRRAIRRLLENQPEAARLGKNGYHKVTKDLSMERYLETVEAAITRLAGSKA